MRASGVIVAALDCVPSAIEDWNLWYDLDHLPPNVALPGIMSGRRYVCTPALHALRAPGSDPWWAESASSFLTIYTLCGDVNETFGAMVALREELDADGRMFAEDLKVVRGGDGLTIQQLSGGRPDQQAARAAAAQPHGSAARSSAGTALRRRRPRRAGWRASGGARLPCRHQLFVGRRARAPGCISRC